MNFHDFSGLPTPGDLVGHWRVIRELGRGGMATVHEVEHSTTGERRALKLMLHTGHGEEEIRRFRREYQALARLDHPNVIRVFEAGLLDDRPYFVMELLEGRELRDEVEAWRELPPAERFRRADRILIQVARALQHIHSQGLVHRDVTPANIILDAQGDARLMDFGVVKEPGTELTTVGAVLGTVAYIAPEQIEGGQVDARADLYSLGAVYYLMLTGRRPFNARTVAGFMEKHLKRPVRPPHELVPTLARRADEVCLRLLEKEPDDRYASATHLLLALDDEEGPIANLRDALSPPRLVGRTAELARLHEAVARLVQREEPHVGPGPRQCPGGLLMLTGQPGMGRTRVAERLVAMAAELGVAVTIARNRAPDQRAFDGFRPLYRDLVGLSSTPPPPALVATFHEDAASSAAPERWAVLEAMKDLVRQSGPRLLAIVDPDRADRGTLEMLEYLVRNLVRAERRPLLFLLTRADDVGADDPLRPILGGETTGVVAETVSLGPISPSAVEELLLTLVVDGPAVRPLAARLHKEGEGNPFFLGEMILVLVDQGVIAPGEAGRRGTLALEAREVDDLVLPVPRTVRQALREWLAPLSAEARSVASALAVARQELDIETLIAVTRLSEDAVVSASEELLDAGLVRERQSGSTERLELARNRLRDVLLETLDEDDRRRIDRAIGDALERAFRRHISAVVEILAHHFERAGLAAKAYPYLVQAADKLRNRTFVAEALDYLDRALAIEPEARAYMTLGEADRRLAELKLLRSRVLFHLGRWTEADIEVRAADALATDLGDARLQATTATELACQARRVLHLDDAEQQLRRALRIADQLGDKRLRIVPLYEYGAVLWSRGDVEGARDYFIQALAGSEAYEDERSLALGYNGLGLIALCRGQSAEARRYFEQSIEVCEKHGLMERLTVARTNLVEVYHLCGNLRKGLDLADSALSHAREVHHFYGIALALRYRVLMLTDIGRVVEAIDNAEEALRIQRALDNREEALASLVVLVRAELAHGDVGRVAELLQAAAALVPEFDTEGFAPILAAWQARVHADAGRSDEARDCLVRAREAPGRQWPFQQVRLDLNVARVHELLGDRAEAVAVAEEALRVADASGYRYYAMRARQLVARLAEDETVAARHLRVAGALARSLAANLPKEDAAVFLRQQGLELRTAQAPLAGELSGS